MTTSSHPTILITGAGTGIGRATADLFFASGWSVLLLGRRPTPLDEIVRHHPERALAIPCDLNDAAQVDAVVAKIRSGGWPGSVGMQLPGSLRALVNNAGVYERATFQMSSDELWRKHFETNVVAPARLSRLIAPILAQNGGGSIVNISSTLGLRPVPGTAAYSASKAALVSLTQTMALDLAADKIRVNCICPGIVDTPIHDFHKPTTPEAAKAHASVQGMQPLGRIGRPDEIAHAIHYFCSPGSEWTTGSVLAVDGGISLV